ncbi:hypothetical protein C1H76_4313 [Elsinoe australis]|uniref:Uncharacterized protein n=1 Tax=Elsinoe australis TaxID=40998 RepID=A0A4U7B3A9_9PEZI|nr:hypothetical protein C1H76_4313 [Elsinoe australis]
MVYRRIAEDKLNAVIYGLACGQSDCAVHRSTAVARGTIRSIRLSLEFFSEPYPPVETHKRHKRKITPFLEEKILEYLSDIPTAYLDEL